MSNVYRVTVKATHSSGVLIEPSLHYQTDLAFGSSEPDPDDVAAGAYNVWGDELRACLPTQITIHEIVAAEEIIPPDIGVAGSHVVEAAGTLTASAPKLPQATVPVINLHTGIRSRSARGWQMLASPGDEGLLNGNNWSSSFKALLDAYAAKLNDSFTLGTLIETPVHPVVYSRTRRSRAESPWTFRVTSATANPQVRWLASRRSAP